MAQIAAGQSGLRAGAGRARIVLPESVFPVDGFDGERDPLHARVVLLDDGQARLAIAVLDQTSIAADSLAGVVQALAGAAEVDPDQVLVCASHTFSAPHVRVPGPAEEGALQLALEHAVAAAASAARRTARDARLGWSSGHCRINVNRDVRTPEGWWLGADEAGGSDHEVGVLRIEDGQGRPIAVLMNYAVQSSILDESVTTDGRRLVSADLAGAASAQVERAYDDEAVALFLIGAAGDQAPYLMANRPIPDRAGRVRRLDAHEAGQVLVELLGERLGAEVVRVSEQIRCVEEPILRLSHERVEVGAQPQPRREDLRPRLFYDYRAAGTTSAPFWAARIGGLALVGVQAELVSATGLWIKKRSPFRTTFVLTMVNGAAKYLADRSSYERMTYAAMNSRYAAGAAEEVADRIVEALHRLN